MTVPRTPTPSWDRVTVALATAVPSMEKLPVSVSWSLLKLPVSGSIEVKTGGAGPRATLLTKAS